MKARLLAVSLALVFALVPSASAQVASASSPAAGDGDANALAAARSAFQRGVKASSRGDYATAERLFREALALHYAPTTAFNLASALYELEQHVEAYNLVQDVLAAPNTPESLRPRAEKLSSALEDEVARLKVVIGGTTNGLSAEVDGMPLPAASLGVPRAVSPGKHQIAAVRESKVISTREVDIDVRTLALVDLSLIIHEAPPVVLAAEAPVAPLAAPPESDRGGWYKRNRKVFWISVAAGAVVIGGGVALGVLLTKKDETVEAPVRGDTGVVSW